MVDSRRKNNFADDRLIETDRQFLDNNNIKPVIKDVLSKVLANRPEDPLAFIANYFESLENKVNLVVKAYQLLTLTHHSRPVFDSNVKAAYDILSRHTVKKNLRGVNGSVCSDLITMLIKDLPSSVTHKLMRRLECQEFEAIPYETFRCAVFSSCVLQDYVKLSESLYASLDLEKSGKVDKTLADCVLGQLRQALTKSTSADPTCIIESSYNLGPDGLHMSLEAALQCACSKGQGSVTSEEFVIEACEAFLTKVKPLK